MKKKNKKKNHTSISEGEIKSKLYGQSKKLAPNEPTPASKITESDIMKKLYPSPEKSDVTPSQVEKPADLFTSKNTIQPGIQEELDTLKAAITSLEEKLKMSLNQKERLKVKLVQKRKLINIRERLADLILNRMPEKFIILLIVFLIFFIFMIMKSLKPEPTKVNEAPQIQLKEEKPPLKDAALFKAEPPQVKIEKIEDKTETDAAAMKKYTIQAAEYADEEAANRFINALKKQGYRINVNTIYRDKNKEKAYFKINVGGFDTLDQAKKFNKIFREKTNIKDSFIKELTR